MVSLIAHIISVQSMIRPEGTARVGCKKEKQEANGCQSTGDQNNRSKTILIKFHF